MIWFHLWKQFVKQSARQSIFSQYLFTVDFLLFLLGEHILQIKNDPSQMLFAFVKS